MEHENANLIFFDSDFSYITSFQKNYVNDRVLLVLVDAKWAENLKKKSESLQTEGRHFRSMICKINDV